MQYFNTWFDTCAFMIFAAMILVYTSRRSVRIFQNNVFFVMLLCMTGATFMNIVAASMDGQGRELVLGAYTAVYLLDIASTLIFAVYVSAFINYRVRRARILQSLLAPAAGAVLLLVANLFTGAIFYVDEYGCYHRGEVYAVIFIIEVCYLLCGMALIYRLRMQIAREKLLLMFPFMITVILGGIIEHFLPAMRLQHFQLSLLSISLYMGLQNPEEHYDRESGLMNQTAMMSHVERKLYSGDACQIVVVAVRGLDMIKDFVGQEGVGELKKEILGTMRRYQKEALIFRLGQGVFAIIPDRDDYARAEEIMQEIVVRFRMPFLKDFYEIELASSCCHFEIPRDARNADEVRSLIRMAVETGRQKGMDIVDLADLDLRHQVYLREIDEKVRNAIRDGKLEVYYQPIYSMAERSFVAAEALLRMHDDDHGFISPAVFIPVAEANGSVVEIDRFVMKEVCRLISGNDLDSLGLHYIELNLSPADCIQEDLADFVDRTLKEYGVSPERLNLEITETASDALTQVVDENVRELNKRGLSFSLDDFGTGYSSMSRIVDLPLSIIKIDKSILQPAFDVRLPDPKRKDAETLLQCYVDMIRQIGCRIVTEGVETRDQAERILELGCDYIQGFYFSKPMDEKHFLRWMKDQAEHPEKYRYAEVYGD